MGESQRSISLNCLKTFRNAFIIILRKMRIPPPTERQRWHDAIHHTYTYEGWRIRAAFVPPDGPAVRMEYSKIVKAGVNAVIQDYELHAIMAANTPAGATWKEIMYNNSDSPNKGLSKIFEGYFAGALGQKMWQRSDGAILWLRSKLIVRLELPARTNTKRNLKRKRNRKPANQFRSSDVKY